MKNIKRILSIVISLILLLSSIYVGGIISVSAETVEIWDGTDEVPATGDGSESNPYKIENAKHFSWAFHSSPASTGTQNLYFELTDNIYLNDISKINWSTGEVTDGYTVNSWSPAYFSGIVNGNGYTVYGMYINNNPTSYATSNTGKTGAGLLSDNYWNRAVTFNDFGMDNVYIHHNTMAAVFVARQDCNNSAKISFDNCYIGENVTVIGSRVGGFVAYGGTCTVAIKNCYSLTASLSSMESGKSGVTAAFLGDVWTPGTKSISNSYCIGKLYGNNKPTASGTDLTTCYETVKSGGVVLTTAQMQGEAAETNMPNLDFDTAFMTTDGYPMLRVFDKEAEKYTVNYHITETEVTQLQVTDDVIFAALEKPTRDGYKFLGFFTDAEFNNAADDNALVYQYSDIYAKWLETPYDAAIWNGAEKQPTVDADGDGYIDITYPSELAWVIANDGNSGSKYELLNDIYLNDITVDAKNGTYTNNADTEPLQWYTKDASTFVGTINGNGHIVYGLFYNDSYADGSTHGKVGAGLIPYASDATITAVGIENAYIKWLSDYSTAAIVGGSHGNTIKVSIDSCYAGENVYVKSNDGAAGILGGGGAKNSGYYVKINNCYSLASLKAAGTGTVYEAGIIGNTWSTANYTVTNCYTVGKLKGNNNAFATYENNYATIASNTAVSTVIAESDMKGITAETSMSGLDFDDTYVITDSYPRLRVFHEGLQSGENLLSAVKLSGASLRIADINGKTVDNSSAGLRFYAYVDTTAGKYRPETNENVEYGILFETKEKLGGAELTIDTVNCARVKADALIGEGEILSYSAELLYLSKDNLDADFVVRGYMINGDEITYTEPQDYCAAVIADKVYEDSEDEGVKERIDVIFAESERFLGSDAEILTFSLFSDFHYKEGMYLTSVADMQSILDNANANNVDFIIHGGDFCNDFAGSPELMNAYLNNNYGLSAYGIYGNHELETAGNSMAVVTPLLTNRADSVVWGTADGEIGDGSIGYYYFDKGNYRIVCTDTNYSYNSTSAQWQHNTENSYGAPSGNLYANSLGPVQLQWLEAVLTDAAQNGKQCIVMGHATFNTAWSGYSPDAQAVTAIYNKVNGIKTGTVIMSLNGHYHTNRMMVADDMLFFDVNTTRNGYWKNGSTEHYTDEQTFQYVKYDTSGNVSSTTTAPLTTLSQSANTWFFENPLSATVKISATGKITIDGVQSNWIYDVTPEDVPEYVTPEISDNTFNLWY